jgi:mannosyltransferase OCH1-like enzyme
MANILKLNFLAMSFLVDKIAKPVTRALIKLIANLSKVLCYGFHFIFPKKRFTLPAQSAPLKRSRDKYLIPRILWQTNFTDRVTLPVYLNYLFNRLMAPTFEYRFMITQARADYIRANYSPEIAAAYELLQIGASQADFCRLLVLQKEGGVYMDIDAHLVWPLEWTLRRASSALYLRIKSGEISNYFIASAPNNPQLEKMIAQIQHNIDANQIQNVYELTGPGVFNKALANEAFDETYYRETVNQGNFTNEYFQYIDKPQGKWNKEQKKTSLLKPKDY